MSKKAVALLAILFLSLSMPSVVSTSPENRWAVVIGVSDYMGDDYDLDYCDDDARDIKGALIDYCGFPEGNIKLLLDSNATKAGIKDAITIWLAGNEALGDLVVITFSGHGTYGYFDFPPIDEEDHYDEYILPHDFLEGFGFDYSIRDDEFGEWISTLESDRIVVVLDSCFAGGMAKGIEETQRTIPKRKVNLIDGFSKDIETSGQVVVLMACAEEGVAYESGELQNGVFTHYLVKGMAGPADGVRRYKEDGMISAEEDFTYTIPLVRKYTRGGQNPEMADGVEGEVVLTVPAPPTELGKICGYVTDAEKGKTIGRATVEVLKTGTDEVIASAKTNGKGHYSIEVSTGTYDIKASRKFYTTEIRSEEVVYAGAEILVDFQLTQVS